MTEMGAARKEHLVRDYMTSTLQTLRPDDRLIDAELLIRRAGVRHIPVMQDDLMVGLLSERDVRRYSPSILDSTPDEYNRIFEQTLVGMVMTRDVMTIPPDTTLVEAVSMLLAQHRGCLPVMEEGKLVGILTRRDILRATIELLGGLPPKPEGEI